MRAGRWRHNHFNQDLKIMGMRICIIGSSAGIGLQCVHVALERGHRVITLSRSLATLPDHPALTRIQGTATQSRRRRQSTCYRSRRFRPGARPQTRTAAF